MTMNQGLSHFLNCFHTTRSNKCNQKHNKMHTKGQERKWDFSFSPNISGGHLLIVSNLFVINCSNISNIFNYAQIERNTVPAHPFTCERNMVSQCNSNWNDAIDMCELARWGSNKTTQHEKRAGSGLKYFRMCRSLVSSGQRNLLWQCGTWYTATLSWQTKEWQAEVTLTLATTW
jgi:hypothetical protein